MKNLGFSGSNKKLYWGTE